MQKQKKNLEVVERGPRWIHNEVPQSEAESLQVPLEENGPCILQQDALNLTRRQWPGFVLQARHHAISLLFSLVKRKKRLDPLFFLLLLCLVIYEYM